MASALSKGSLARRILTISSLLFALPLLIYFFTIFHYDYEAKLDEIVKNFKSQGKSRAYILSDLAAFNFRSLEIVEGLLQFSWEDSHLTDAQMNILLQNFAAIGHFEAIAFFSALPGGRFICSLASDPAKIGKDYTNSYYVQSAAAYNEISFLAFGKTTHQRRFYVSKAIYSKNSLELLGVLTISMPVYELLKKITFKEDANVPISFSIVTQEQVVFESSDPALILHSLRPLQESERVKIALTEQFVGMPVVEGAVEHVALEGYEQVGELTFENQTYIGVFVPIPGTDLTLLLHINQDKVFYQEHRALFLALSIFSVVFVIGATATLWFTSRMAKPLESLGATMEEVSKGNLSARYRSDKWGFEINAIGNIFNETMKRLIHNMEVAENERVQKETLSKELKIGYDIQTSIFPREMPTFPNIEIEACYSPAKEVGGDFYDLFVKKSKDIDQLVITIADAAGKGISACLYSLCLRSMLRSFYVEHESLGEVMKSANNLFCYDTDKAGMFVTVLTTIFNPLERSLTYSSCGHNPGLLCRLDGNVESLSSPGLAMGVLPYESVQAKKVLLQVGDLVVLYTDGVTEAPNAKGALFGEQRLRKLLAANRNKPLKAIIDAILFEISKFSKGIPQFDDITMILMRIK